MAKAMDMTATVKTSSGKALTITARQFVLVSIPTLREKRKAAVQAHVDKGDIRPAFAGRWNKDKAKIVGARPARPWELDRSNGIHVVYDGLNASFEKLFGVPSNDCISEMEEANEIVKLGAAGGPMIYLTGEAPKRDNSKANEERAEQVATSVADVFAQLSKAK